MLDSLLATVQMPAGIPVGTLAIMGTPSTGTIVCAAMTPARWAAPPAAAMITFHTTVCCGCREVGRQFRSAMGRHHATLMSDAKLGQRLVGMTHGIPVRLAAHDHSDQRQG